eukprot:scaffold4383_cov390-Prasinococcus_capsulatus_cf.AAC.5
MTFVRSVSTLCDSHQSTLGRPVTPAALRTCVGLYSSSSAITAPARRTDSQTLPVTSISSDTPLRVYEGHTSVFQPRRCVFVLVAHVLKHGRQHAPNPSGATEHQELWRRYLFRCPVGAHSVEATGYEQLQVVADRAGRLALGQSPALSATLLWRGMLEKASGRGPEIPRQRTWPNRVPAAPLRCARGEARAWGGSRRSRATAPTLGRAPSGTNE